MSKLPALKSQKLIKILKKKGFILDRVKGSHHIYYMFWGVYCYQYNPICFFIISPDTMNGFTTDYISIYQTTRIRFREVFDECLTPLRKLLK